MRLFCRKLPASVELFYLQLTILAFLLTVGAWSFFVAYSGKMCLIMALRDSKQRSFTVSKKAPTVNKKSFPRFRAYFEGVSDTIGPLSLR